MESVKTSGIFVFFKAKAMKDFEYFKDCFSSLHTMKKQKITLKEQ